MSRDDVKALLPRQITVSTAQLECNAGSPELAGPVPYPSDRRVTPEFLQRKVIILLTA